jgi:hypothetical protein
VTFRLRRRRCLLGALAGRRIADFRLPPSSAERIWRSRQYLLVDGNQATGAVAALGDFDAVFREHFAPV